tara:strand:+ start:319 stop:516 length:198 start_codon:yes stop_codon:yes gene_type:complete
MANKEKLPKGIKIIKNKHGLPEIRVTGLPYLTKKNCNNYFSNLTNKAKKETKEDIYWDEDWDYDI